MKLFLLLVLTVPTLTFAHSGRTNSSGCHNNTKTGGYHCHNSNVPTEDSKGAKVMKENKEKKGNIKVADVKRPK